MSSNQKIINSISDFEQRIFIKFAILLGWSGGITRKNLQKAVGGKALAESTIYSWIKKINDGRTDVSEARGGDTSDQNLRLKRREEIQQAMDDSRHWSMRSLSQHLDIPLATLRSIVVDDLKMKKKMGKWVSPELTAEQKMTRVLACRINLQDYSKHPDRLRRTFSVDETWVSLYMEPDRNQAKVYLYPGEETPEMPHANIHAAKRMLIVAMDFEGIAFWKLMKPKTTINGESYVAFLKEKLPGWLRGKSFRSPVLFHDNARPHVATVVKEFLEQQKIDTWFQPAYSPDISPLDFDCFAKLKGRLRGTHYTNWEQFENSLDGVIKDLNKERAVLGVQQLPGRWKRVIDCKGSYL